MTDWNNEKECLEAVKRNGHALIFVEVKDLGVFKCQI